MARLGNILVVMTNHVRYPTRTDSTGLWLTELTHFYQVAQQAGYTLDFVSPLGGVVPLDQRSLKWPYMDRTAAYLQDQAFVERLNNTLAPEQISPESYQAIYFTGGHGVMWDFADNQALGKIGQRIYQQGGVLAAVCHGVAGLLAVTDQTGQPIIAGRKLTGFSNQEEWLSGMRGEVPFLLEDRLKKQGAVYSKGWLPFTAYVVTDDRIITGQNSQSPKAVAKAVIQRLVKL